MLFLVYAPIFRSTIHFLDSIFIISRRIKKTPKIERKRKIDENRCKAKRFLFIFLIQSETIVETHYFY